MTLMLCQHIHLTMWLMSMCVSDVCLLWFTHLTVHYLFCCQHQGERNPMIFVIALSVTSVNNAMWFQCLGLRLWDEFSYGKVILGGLISRRTPGAWLMDGNEYIITNLISELKSTCQQSFLCSEFDVLITWDNSNRITVLIICYYNNVFYIIM